MCEITLLHTRFCHHTLSLPVCIISSARVLHNMPTWGRWTIDDMPKIWLWDSLFVPCKLAQFQFPLIKEILFLTQIVKFHKTMGKFALLALIVWNSSCNCFNCFSKYDQSRETSAMLEYWRKNLETFWNQKYRNKNVQNNEKS